MIPESPINSEAFGSRPRGTQTLPPPLVTMTVTLIVTVSMTVTMSVTVAGTGTVTLTLTAVCGACHSSLQLILSQCAVWPSRISVCVQR